MRVSLEFLHPSYLSSALVGILIWHAFSLVFSSAMEMLISAGKTTVLGEHSAPKLMCLAPSLIAVPTLA